MEFGSRELTVGALQVAFKSILLLLHLLDFFIEVVNVGVNFVLELLLLILQLNHFDLLHFFIKLGHLLLSTLAVSKLPIVRMNLFFNLVFLGTLLCSFLCLLLCFSLSLFRFLGLCCSLLLFLAALGLVLLQTLPGAPRALIFEPKTLVFRVLSLQWRTQYDIRLNTRKPLKN